MKQKLLNSMKLRATLLVAILCSLFTGTAWGADVVAYTLTPASGSNNAYANNCDITISGITWNLTGNSQQIPWRIGGKSLNGVDRTLYSKTAISDNITKIEVTHGAASSVTVNSWTVIVSKNPDFSNPVSTLTPTFATNTTTTISRPDGKDWSNCYFKFVYNVTIGGNNKFIEFSEAKFYKAGSSGPVQLDAPELTATAGNGSVTLEWDEINNASSYTIQYADNSSFTGATTITDATSPEEITGLTNGTTYYFKAMTVGDGTNYLSSDYGDAVSATPANVSKITITQDELTDFTNSYDWYDWTVGGVSGSAYAYKNSGMQFNSGRDGYWIYNTSAIPGTITSVKMVKASGTDRSWTLKAGTSVISTTDGGTQIGDSKTVGTSGATWDVEGSYKYFCLIVSGGSTVISSIEITYIPSTDPAISASDVDITYVATSGSIDYTLENATGNVSATVTTGSDWLTLGTITSSAVPFTCTANTGAERTATVTLSFSGAEDKVVTVTQAAQPPHYTTISDLFARATSTATDVLVTFDDWVVSAVSTYNVYVTDGTNGFIINIPSGTSDYAVGNILSGTAVPCSLKLNYGYAQLTGVSGLTVTTGGTVSTANIAMASLAGVNTGALVSYNNLTCTVNGGTYTLTDGTTTIQLYKTLYDYTTTPDLVNGHKYNITGIYQQYNSTKEILPRSSADIVEVFTPAISVTPTTLSDFTYVVNNGPSTTKTVSVSGSNLTADITLSLENNSDFEMSTTEGSGYTNSLTLTQSAGAVEATTVYVRLKAGLAVVNSYSGTITLTSTGATDVEVSLSGSVTAPEAAHVTWDLTTNSYESSSTTQVDWTSSYATMVLTKGTSQTNANNFLGNSSNDHTRFYKDQVLTFTPVTGYTITEVEITAVSSYATGFVGNDWTNALASASGTKVTITPTDGTIAFSGTISAACRATEVKVYYEADNAPSISLTSTSVNADAAGDNGTIDITYANLTISDMSDFGVQFYNDQDEEISDPTWLEVLVAEQDPSIGEGYVVSYDIQANDGAARTAYFKVFADGGSDFVYTDLVTVTQEAYVAPTPVTAGSKWLKTDLDKLTSTNIFVIVGTDEDNDSYAIPNDATDAPSAISVTVSGTTLSGDIASNLLWNISGNATDGYTFYNGNTWLGCNTTAASSNNNNIRVGTEDRNVFVLDGDNYLVTKDDYVDRYLSIYVNSGTAQDWRGYVNTNSAVAMSFFKQIEAVKLNDSYGYATFASTSPLDFTDYETADFSAWAITGISGETITFNQITTTVPAGTGMLLKGDQGSTVAISVANEDGTAVTNKLEGVTSATAITAGQYYGLSGNTFVKVNAGTVPAGKALLPAGEVDGSGAKAFTFVFEGADGIKTVEQVSAEEAAEIFNLAGQRMSKPVKGVNIINGKKVLVK